MANQNSTQGRGRRGAVCPPGRPGADICLQLKAALKASEGEELIPHDEVMHKAQAIINEASHRSWP